MSLASADASRADKRGVSETFTDDATKRESETHGVSPFAVIETENLFIKIAEQMERFYRNVGALEHSFNERPEVLNGVGVNVALDVRNRVVDDLVIEFGSRPEPVSALFIGAEGIGVENGLLGVNVFTDEGHDVFAASARHDAERGLARNVASPPLNRADNRSHMGASGFLALHHPFALVAVHEASLAADEGLINFDLPVELLGFGLQRETQTRQHEPRGFLSHAEGAREFVAADTVLAVGDQPERREPLFEPERGIFEDGSDFERELGLGVFGVALVSPLALQPRDIAPAADGASDLTGRPSDRFDSLPAVSEILEEDDCFAEGLGFAFASHGRIMAGTQWLGKYIITHLTSL